MSTMSIGSINMAINNGDVERRYEDLTEYMLNKRPDLLLVQEVSIDIGQTALRGLAKQLGDDYSFHYEAVYPGQEDEQGMAVLSSMPVIRAGMTDFSCGGNQAQTIELRAKRHTLKAANVHFEVKPKTHKIKATELTDEGFDFIAGDINALPFFPTTRTFRKKGYVSAYKAVHGHEPFATFPMMGPEALLKGHYMKPSEIEALKKISALLYPISREKLEIPAYTTDYVFLARSILRATHAELIERKARYQPVISDHAGHFVRTAIV